VPQIRISAVWFGTALAALLAVAAPEAARADGITLGGNDKDMLELGAGVYDVDHNNTAGVFRGEFRFGDTKLWVLTPILGGEVTTDGGVYGYGGFALDINLGDQWVLAPNEAVGLWARGDGKNLGSVVEFRSGAEIDYRFEDDERIGFSFHHISNAGIGKHNPGEEEALVLWSFPLAF
jgi:lipid A 3-O-deacylase